MTGSDDHSLKIWDAASHSLVKTFEHGQPIWRAVFSPNDNGLIASSAADGSILLWNLDSGERVPVSMEGHAVDAAGLQFTVDGKHLVSTSDDGSVIFWNVETGVEQFVFHEQPARERMHVSFSDDGESMVVTGVGRVEIRHAIFEFEFPYRLTDSLSDEAQAFTQITGGPLPESELLKLLEVSKKICRTYPNFKSLGIMGAVQYRLGRYEEATELLTEAQRVEKATYEFGAIQPYIEAYLTLAHASAGNREKALDYQKQFDRAALRWAGYLDIDELNLEIRDAIDNLLNLKASKEEQSNNE